ncbi:MAG: polysaccharide lyase family 7 protein, partial [Melioribacteraceae bacterium]|nr:polysaccharide lyase family 7 protein [Melioribacteraceae bacterium]
MIKIFKYLLLFFIAIQLMDVINAQSGETTIIQGTVSSAIDNPIPDVKVKIMDLGNTGLADSTTTDVTGFYNFEITTLTDIEHVKEIPNSFSLSQNYPNPFSKNTSIDFSIEKEGYAKLEIFNTIGQKVITLFDNHASPNKFIVNWNGRNFNGKKIANGFYIYRLKLNDQIISKKMLYHSGETIAPQIGSSVYGNNNNSPKVSKINNEYNFQITISHPTIATINDTLNINTEGPITVANYIAAYSNYAGYPSDVISYFDKWKITLGDGSGVSNLVNYENEDYFYNSNDNTDWVVYKTPNSGGTTPNSSNTRSELRQKSEWTPETGGKLDGTLKVMNVSTTGDARVPATFSVVVGQIHSSEGHENEPLKIFYKKFPGHTKGSVFWNYEINTDGDNGERWDYSIPVWGYDWSVVGLSADSYPDEPIDGIELGEEFSYEVNVYNGIMYLTFRSEEHETKTFTKSLVTSE